MYFSRQLPDEWRPLLYVSTHETTRHIKDSTDRHMSVYLSSLKLQTAAVNPDGSSVADVGIARQGYTFTRNIYSEPTTIAT